MVTTEPDEALHRAACILRYLAKVVPMEGAPLSSDEDFGRVLILQDLATMLDWHAERDGQADRCLTVVG